MPNSAPNVTVRTTGKRNGKINVIYRDGNGKTRNAVVLGAGSASGLKLQLTSGEPRRIIDNVPLTTGVKQTNVYFHKTYA